MRASPVLTRALALAAALVFPVECANKPHASDQVRPSAAPPLPDLPEPPGVLGEFQVAHPDATYRALRELGRPLSALLPAGLPMLTANLLGLPALSADSFDPDLPVLGLLAQAANREPGWVLAVHAVSGPELIAKLCTGSGAPFRTEESGVAGLKPILPSSARAASAAKTPFSLAVFDNYLLIANSGDLLRVAGPYAARSLPRRPAPKAPIALRFSSHALESNVVPAVRALWSGYRTRLAQSDAVSRSAHGGHAPDFADPALVILGADTLVESLLSLIDGGVMLELDVEPAADRLALSITLEPEAGSEVEAKLATLASGTAQCLLRLPAETQFALCLSRSDEDRQAAINAAGDDWVRLLGSRLTDKDARQLRGVLSDWEFGRGTQTSYGFLGGQAPGAFLLTEVADADRMKRAGAGFFSLLAVPGLRAPIAEFLGQPHVSESKPAVDAVVNGSRRKITFSPVQGQNAATPPLTFAWLVNATDGFAAASKNADLSLKIVVGSAHGEHESLAAQVGIAESLGRIGDRAALFAYADARILAHELGDAANAVAPLLVALGWADKSAYLRLEISKPAVDLALHGALGL
jgi:hypothetical protein